MQPRLRSPSCRCSAIVTIYRGFGPWRCCSSCSITPASAFLRGGFVGVDVFFVLSGFLITGSCSRGRRKRGHVSLVDFYSRRARRILPAAALTLVVTTIVAVLPAQLRSREAGCRGTASRRRCSPRTSVSRSKEPTTSPQGQPPSPVLHYWSLSVEEQFYLVWPTLLSLALFGRSSAAAPPPTRRRDADDYGSGQCGGCSSPSSWRLASLVWSIHETSTLPPAAYFSTFTRAWELALGAALAMVASTRDADPSRHAGRPWVVGSGCHRGRSRHILRLRRRFRAMRPSCRL